MVAELLRLSTRLAVNQIRSSPWAALHVFLHALIAVGGILLIYVGAIALGRHDDAFAARMVVVCGSLITFATFALPLFESRDEILDRRALRGYGIRPWRLALALILVSFAGPALLVLVPLGFAPLALWGGGDVGSVAAVAAIGLALVHVLNWRLGRAGGAALRTRPRVRRFVRLAAAIVALAGVLAVALTALPRLVPYLQGTPRSMALDVLHISATLRGDRLDAVLAWTPLGALWAAPVHRMAGDAEAVSAALQLAGGTIVALVIVWLMVVRASFRTTWRTRAVRRRGVPGWFRFTPSSSLGAVLARSFTYWVRDPRYRALFVLLPVIPILALVALWLGGVPLSFAALVPLPIVVLLIAWGTLHNDVAYDSSAVWTHVAAAVPGVHDRLGRAIPVLLWGALVLGVGVPLTVWAHGSPGIAPAVTGVGLVLLLAGVGVSSIRSVRSPYPAPRPGDGAFQQPQVAGGFGIDAQAGSLVLVLLAASPALVASGLWLAGYDGPWNWVALVAGAGIGALVLVVGIRVGGRDFEEAGPELLAFTMRN